MKRVAVIHPWFPRYRLEFFDLLVRRAKHYNIDVHVFHGDPPPEWVARGDAVRAEWATRLPTRFLRVRGKALVVKNLRALLRDGPYDLYVLEHAVRSVETYALLAHPRAPIAFWGHGRTYTQTTNAVQERVKASLLRWCTWYFAYTEGGARAVRAEGMPAERITVVQNSIDTDKLKTGIAAVTEEQVRAFREAHGTWGPTALFIGGLDASKRLDFLFRAGSLIAERLPAFRLLVAGDGEERSWVETRSLEAPWVEYLGPLHGSGKATALRVSDVLCMPGRVGLVAVDSFAAETPIITTNWPYHAPEYEYLVDGSNSVVTDDCVEDYAARVVSVLGDDAMMSRLRTGCCAASEQYTVEHMVDNFMGGLRQALM